MNTDFTYMLKMATLHSGVVTICGNERELRSLVEEWKDAKKAGDDDRVLHIEGWHDSAIREPMEVIETAENVTGMTLMRM